MTLGEWSWLWAAASAVLMGVAVLCCWPPSQMRAQRHHLVVSVWIRRAAQRIRPGQSPASDLRQDCAELLRQFSALLQSGRSEAHAWRDVHLHWRRRRPEHVLTRVAALATAAEASGEGAATGLRRAAEQLPQQGLTSATRDELDRLLQRLLAATALSEQTGAPLSGLVNQMAEGMDAAAALAGAIETAVAGPRLTQLLLTLLPLGGLILGQLMGAAPFVTLLSGTLGLLCLVLGIGALMTGRIWSQRMLKTVTGRA